MKSTASIEKDDRLAPLWAKLSTEQRALFARLPRRAANRRGVLDADDGDMDMELPGREPPTELLLFKFGWNVTSKGNFLFDELSAMSCMAAFYDQGVDIMADWEHRSLIRDQFSQVDDSKASAWCRLEVREDGLYAVDIKWTPKAEEQIRNGEYRYYSPAFDFDDQRRVTRLINFALTNRPATKNQPAMVAANDNDGDDDDDDDDNQENRMNPISCAKCSATLSADEKGMMTAYCTACAGEGRKEMSAALSAALGVEKFASSAEAIDAVGGLASMRRDVLSMTGAKSPAEAVGTLLAWKASHERVSQLAADLDKVRKDQRLAVCSALIEQGKKDGKISPAMEGFWKLQAEKSDGEETLRAFLSQQTAVVATSEAVPTAPAETRTLAALSDEERKLAKSLGLSEEAALKGKQRFAGR